MNKKHLNYLATNKFAGGLWSPVGTSHIAGCEKEGKALIISRFADDPIGREIAAVYNLYTKQYYICPPGIYNIKINERVEIEIINDPFNGCNITPCLKVDGEGISGCSYKLTGGLCWYPAGVDNEKGVAIEDLVEDEVIILSELDWSTDIFLKEE